MFALAVQRPPLAEESESFSHCGHFPKSFLIWQKFHRTELVTQMSVTATSMRGLRASYTPALSRFPKNLLTLQRVVQGSQSHSRALNTPTPAYPGHIPLNWFENAFLAVGSACMALADPRRGGASNHPTILFLFVIFLQKTWSQLWQKPRLGRVFLGFGTIC